MARHTYETIGACLAWFTMVYIIVTVYFHFN